MRHVAAVLGAVGHAGEVQAYRQFLIDYSAQQKALGRFERPATDAKLYSLMGWLAHENLVPDVRLQLWLALGFLIVCIVNIVALLLAKFLRRSGEISVRRALGARRADIFMQFGIESAMVGLVRWRAGSAVGPTRSCGACAVAPTTMRSLRRWIHRCCWARLCWRCRQRAGRLAARVARLSRTARHAIENLVRP